MRVFGVIILVIGFLLLLVGVSMDVTVATGMGGRVYNIGLMNERSNLFTFGGIAALVGVLLIIFGGKKNPEPSVAAESVRPTRPCPFCAEPILPEAIKCKHCGSEVEPALTAEPDARDIAPATIEKQPVFMAKEGTPSHQKSSFEPPKKGGSRLEGVVILISLVLIVVVVAGVAMAS
nr:hypothetical protein [uncultured Pseudomonas sp.]